MSHERTFTPEQIEVRRDRARRWYHAHREVVLDRLRQRTPEERSVVSERRRERYATNPLVREQVKAQSAAFRANPANREGIYAAQRAYDNSELGQATRRAIRLRTYFHLTVEQYDDMLAAQGGVCAICKEPETHQHRGVGVVQSLSVDHNHSCCPGKTSCGKCVRGLLCDRCNVGRWPDDPALLRAAADYFESWR